MQVLAGKVASISVEDAVHCEDGFSALQDGLQCAAGRVAVHCRKGGSALRLRGAKLVPKSSVLLWMREKGGKNQLTGEL